MTILGEKCKGTLDINPHQAAYNRLRHLRLSLSDHAWLGSNQYVTEYQNPKSPKGTNYWFKTVQREQATTKLFNNAWPGGEQYYDPYWATLAELTSNQGYLSPFNDRWAQFIHGIGLGGDYRITWELGIPTTT